MKKSILFILFICSLVFSGCEYDNYDSPKSSLSGRVVYENEPVGVRTNGIELELWQEGFGLRKNIPIYVAHDGTYSVSLFNGQYKLVRKAGAPWEAQLADTIIVDVKKKTVLDVPIKPYFVVQNETYQKGAGSITAKFTIDKIIQSANMQSVKLYFGKSILTDENKNEGIANVDISSITIGKETTVTANIPTNLAKEDYLFVRIGVRSTVSNEFYYTQIQKIEIK